MRALSRGRRRFRSRCPSIRTCSVSRPRERDRGPALRSGDATIVLHASAAPRTLPETGAHVAYRLPRAALDAALARLAEAASRVHRYLEDRADEAAQNRYCADPAGNRIQLV